MSFRAVAPLLLLFLFLTCAHQAEHCWVCHREVHPSVHAVLTLADGRKVTACCPRCALHYKEEPGNRIKSIAVTDYPDGSMLSLGRAFLVEGSDETPCVHHAPMADSAGGPMQICYDRCMPSLIAFRDAGAARAFLSSHGGTLYEPGSLPVVGPDEHR